MGVLDIIFKNLIPDLLHNVEKLKIEFENLSEKKKLISTKMNNFIYDKKTENIKEKLINFNKILTEKKEYSKKIENCLRGIDYTYNEHPLLASYRF